MTVATLMRQNAAKSRHNYELYAKCANWCDAQWAWSFRTQALPSLPHAALIGRPTKQFCPAGIQLLTGNKAEVLYIHLGLDRQTSQLRCLYGQPGKGKDKNTQWDQNTEKDNQQDQDRDLKRQEGRSHWKGRDKKDLINRIGTRMSPLNIGTGMTPLNRTGTRSTRLNRIETGSTALKRTGQEGHQWKSTETRNVHNRDK
jgi:hypothetical protein